MTQCPSCSSFNDAGASFCNQCGRALARKPSARLRVPRNLVLFLAGASLVGGLVAILVAVQLHGLGEKAGRRPLLSRRSPPLLAPATTPETPPPAEPSEPEPLSLEAILRLADQALVVIDLLGESGERLRETRGVLLDAPGAVLTRFRPLLGAQSGSCRALRGGDRARELLGLVAYDPYRDLAVLEVRAGEAPGGLPAAAGPEGALLEAGTEVVVAAPGRAAQSRVTEYPYFTADGGSHARLAGDPPFPAGSLLALDPYGSLIGLCAPEPAAGGEEAEAGGSLPGRRLLVDPISTLAESLGHPASLTLAEVSRRFYEGTFADLLERGRRALEARSWAAAMDLLGQALDQADREQVGAEGLRVASELLRQAAHGELEERRRAKDLRGAAACLALLSQRFPDERRTWVDLGAARLELEEHREAIAALLEARRIEPGTDLDALLQRAYLDASARELSVGRLPVAAEWLEKGLQVLPGSARLHLELAKLYQRWGLYDDAARVYAQARVLDPGLGAEVDAALERMEETIRRREAVVLEIPPGSSTIQADAVLNGALTCRFIIDTGATYTSISQEMADALGYRIGPTAERLVVGTANGVISAPVIVLDSVNLQGYAVRNLKTLVLPQKAQSQVGLLGLNFLDHFRYSVDAGRREFRLEKR